MAYPRLIYQNLATGEEIEFSPYTQFHCNVAGDAVGLSDVHATVNTVRAIGQHGSAFASSQIDEREITIKGILKTVGNLNKSLLRRKLAHVLDPASPGRLTYVLDSFRRRIDCRAEQAPVITPGRVADGFTVDLRCPSPFWEDTVSSSQGLSGFTKYWEFAWEIPEAGFEFGLREENVFVEVQNSGDTASGMLIEFTSGGAVSGPQLLNSTTGEFFKLNLDMEPGDRVQISTFYDRKTAILIRDNVATNVFQYVDPGSSWMQLPIGSSWFLITSDSGTNTLDVAVTFTPLYLAV